MFLSSFVFPQLVSLSGAIVFVLRVMMTSCSSSERLTNSFQICKHGNLTLWVSKSKFTSYCWSSIYFILHISANATYNGRFENLTLHPTQCHQLDISIVCYFGGWPCTKPDKIQKVVMCSNTTLQLCNSCIVNELKTKEVQGWGSSNKSQPVCVYDVYRPF